MTAGVTPVRAAEIAAGERLAAWYETATAEQITARMDRGGRGMWIANVRRKCEGCGEMTLARRFARVGHAACIPEPAPPADVATLRFLEDLQRDPCRPPRAQYGQELRPVFWMPPSAPITDLVSKSYWSWKRTYAGPVSVLDRSGAWIAATSSIKVAHGALVETGPTRRYIGPGYYKVPVMPEWSHPWLPHPLAGLTELPASDDGAVWVPHPRAELLWQLAGRGIWPEFEAIGSWTCEKAVRLDRWAGHVRDIRRAVIEQFGRDSEQYGELKNEFSQSVTAMLGERNPGQGRTWRCKVHRPDWYHGIEGLTAVTLYRWYWDLTEVCKDASRPELAPVGMRNIDELLIPTPALELVTTRKRLGGRDPLRIDQTGITLGTFKIKGEETWA